MQGKRGVKPISDVKSLIIPVTDDGYIEAEKYIQDGEYRNGRKIKA